LNRIPSSVFEEVDLLVVNEIEYLYWSKFSTSDLKSAPTYLDLHEDHVHHADRGLLERFAFRKYWVWQLEQLVSFAGSREAKVAITCVEQVIADSYAKVLGMPVEIILNAPDENDLRPGFVDSRNIKLVHHGMGTKGRGIEESIRALKWLEPEFTLDLILFSTPLFNLKIKLIAAAMRVASRVQIVPGVPLAQLPQTLNEYDISVILLSDVTAGHLNALPNKLFESIQSKLAIVTGPNPSMRKIVLESGVGISLETWGSKELASALAKLSAGDIEMFKAATLAASKKYSTQASQKAFGDSLKILGVGK
jgi:glycosyltransferase involved in cell wall biosynthesis